jgi:hypothetical protein
MGSNPQQLDTRRSQEETAYDMNRDRTQPGHLQTMAYSDSGPIETPERLAAPSHRLGWNNNHRYVDYHVVVITRVLRV